MIVAQWFEMGFDWRSQRRPREQVQGYNKGNKVASYCFGMIY